MTTTKNFTALVTFITLIICSVSYTQNAIAASDNEDSEPTIEEIQEYLNQKNAAAKLQLPNKKLDLDFNSRRIPDSDPRTSGEGKIHILVHKSDNDNRLEHLEVFRQKSDDDRDLEPVLLFDNNTTHKALVSTGGNFGARAFPTPSGTFLIDSIEKMHYSRKYNNAPMPFTMFFNQGIAIHAASPSGFKNLGRKASHGCVRVHPINAKILFDFVNSVIAEKNDKKHESVVVKVLDF